MTRFKKGDRVIIIRGDFKGEWGLIVDKDIIGDELTVALADSGRRSGPRRVTSTGWTTENRAAHWRSGRCWRTGLDPLCPGAAPR